MNSALQCLYRVQPLTVYIQLPAVKGLRPHDQLRKWSSLGTEGCVLNAYCHFVDEMVEAGETGRTVSPHQVKHEVGRHNSTFADYGQHDATEFLVTLLDGLHEDLNQARAVIGNVPNLDFYNGMKFHRICNDSKIVDLFHGESCTTLKFDCGAEQLIHEPLASWPLSIPTGKASLNLEDCISAWQQPQHMTGDNGLFCDECNDVEGVQRTIRVVKFAPVVIVQLKRFSQVGNRLRKNNTPVSYPISFQTAQCADVDTGERHLTGVIHHSGTLDGGHYTCIVRDLQNPELWYDISDSWVSRVSSRMGPRITDSSAMTLMYQKKP
jgi:ubiquitin C-terminal hydrolase